MSDPQPRATQADTEAAAWHTRLGDRSVTAETLTEFYDWRRDPANDAAYRKVETVWAKARNLEGRPDIQAAVAEALARNKKPDHRALWIGAVVATAGAALAIGGLFWIQGRNAYETAVGEGRVVQLADGSTVRLDTGSSIRVTFSGDRRRVELEKGRALFTVAHDAARPFFVDADGTRVRAVGTIFDVRRAPTGVTVSMVSGLIDVTGDEIPGGQPKRLGAGQQVRVSPRGVTTRAVNIADATSWTQGRLVFRDTPLVDAVAEVNRYLTDKIILDPGPPQDAQVSGVFHTGDREAFVSAASELFRLKAASRADGSVHLSADQK